MAIDEKLKHLSSFLDESVYELIAKYVARYCFRLQETLVNNLVTYVELLQEPLNSKNAVETSLCLSYIRTHICKRRSFASAKQCFSCFLHLVTYLINEGWFEKSTSLEKPIENANEYAFYREEVIPEEAIKKIKYSPLELFDNTLNSCCSSEISQRIKKYLNSFQATLRSRHRAPLTAFLNQVAKSHSRWYEKSSIIQTELLNYREGLNTNLVINNRTPHFNYTKVTNILSDLIKHKLLPQDTILPIYTLKNIDGRINAKRTESLGKNLEHLSSILDSNIYDEIAKFSSTLSYNNQWELVRDLVIYIELLRDPFNSKDSTETSVNMIYIRNHLCQRLGFQSAKVHFSYLLDLVHDLIKKGWHEESISLPPP